MSKQSLGLEPKYPPNAIKLHPAIVCACYLSKGN